MKLLKNGRIKLTVLLILLSAPGILRAQNQQDSTVYANGWYVGLQAGTSLGQCTFRSVTEHDTRLGFQGGVFAGCRLSRLLSLEGAFAMGGQSQAACDCCPYWLSDDGQRYFAPLKGHNGSYYRDFEAHTVWQRLGVQFNIDLLSLVTRETCRWHVSLSPQISAFHTDTDLRHGSMTFSTPWADGSQWHLGLGGQMSVGYSLSRRVEACLYGGLTHLTGQRFDLLPQHGHKSNLIYDMGLRLTFNLNR